MNSASGSTRARPRDVYAQLRALIVAGRMAPGMRLIEAEVADQLAVSRTPVREAIRRLAHEGLAHVVKVGAKTKIAVAPATIADLGDLFAIIGALEGVAGRGAARLAPARRRELAADLTRLNDRFARLAQARLRPSEEFFESHDAFHATLVDRCASERLKRLISGVRPQVKRYELLYATAVGTNFGPSLREHRAIIAAVRNGTGTEIERAIRLNWSNSAVRLSAGVAATPIAALGSYRDYQETPRSSRARQVRPN
jgi:DNA-binding GntR family transcriptional regulator